MGTLVGHVAPGLFFFAIGFWHLFNHMKLHSLRPNSYTASPWFPTSRFKYIELILIMMVSSMSITMELFGSPAKHQPLDSDGTIPTTHLHNFEHSFISMSFLTYAVFALLLDKYNLKAKDGLTYVVGGVAFAQELLLFHLHSTDHMGVEGQYHLLLQCVIFVSLATTLMGVGLPKSFMVSFVRSVSVLFQGVWLIIMGYMLWTPALIPKGCFIHTEEAHQVVRCSGHEALYRAKGLANILFSWTVTTIMVLGLGSYLVVAKLYGEKVEYSKLTNMEDLKLELELELKQDSDDVESPTENKHGGPKSFIDIGKEYSVMNIGR